MLFCQPSSMRFCRFYHCVPKNIFLQTSFRLPCEYK
nr:unnamed protein product [Callosobruchus chinensis]